MDEKLLSADEIVAAPDAEFEDVHVPEWNGTVRIRVLSAGEAIEFTERVKGEARKNMMLILLQLTLSKADGTPMFTPQQLQAIGKKNLKILARLQEKALKLNDLWPDKKKDRDLVDEAKND